MKAIYHRDRFARQNFKTYENKVRCLKVLKINASLRVNWWARHKLASFPNRVYKNRCLSSNKGSSIKKDFKLSRHELKRWTGRQSLPGVVKASW